MCFHQVCLCRLEYFPSVSKKMHIIDYQRKTLFFVCNIWKLYNFFLGIPRINGLRYYLNPSISIRKFKFNSMLSFSEYFPTLRERFRISSVLFFPRILKKYVQFLVFHTWKNTILRTQAVEVESRKSEGSSNHPSCTPRSIFFFSFLFFFSSILISPFLCDY